MALSRFAVSAAALFALAACDPTAMKTGDAGAKTEITGSAGGANSSGANSALEKCDSPLGTAALLEDQTQSWYSILTQEYKLTSTVPLIRLMAQQSGCFVVVERGKAFDALGRERELARGGESRSGSKFHKGQMVAADYTISPEVIVSNNDAGGIGGVIGGAGFAGAGLLGGVLGAGLSKKEASTMLMLIDNRSGVQLAASEGSAAKSDLSMGLGALGIGGGGAVGAGIGGYANTAQGKVIAAAFLDSFNGMVKSLKNYKAQEVKGGLGKGGNLKVGK